VRVYNAFIVTLALLFGAITVLMAAQGAERIDAFYTAYAVALLALSALFMYFSPRARRALARVSLVAVAGFGLIVVLRVVEILSRR